MYHQLKLDKLPDSRLILIQQMQINVIAALIGPMMARV